MLRRLGSIAFWTFLGASSIALFPGAVLLFAVTWPFDRRRVLLHRYTCFWASLYTWLNPVWRVRIEGREKIDPRRTYVMVANHQSLLDILVLFRLRTHFKWVSKRENFAIPFIGWNMTLNGYVPLTRGDPASVARMMEASARALSERSSVMMFPEGTRSADGRLREFKHGAFTLARRAGVDLLPIVVEGTGAALPKKGFVLQGRHAIRVRILDPIRYESFADTDADVLASDVRDVFAAALGEPVRGRRQQALAA